MSAPNPDLMLAIKAISDAISMDKHNPEAWIARAFIYAQIDPLREQQRIIQSLQNAAILNPNPNQRERMNLLSQKLNLSFTI